MIENLFLKKIMISIKSEQDKTKAQNLASKVKCMIFDVDGVLTNGTLKYTNNFQQNTPCINAKEFHALDGYGIKLLAKSGILIAIITGCTSEIVAERASNLGIKLLYQGIEDKHKAFTHLLERIKLDAKDCGYMGDDWPDLPVMKQVAFAVCPPTAHEEIHNCSCYITKAAAGFGAAREVCDFILRAQGLYEKLLEDFLGEFSIQNDTKKMNEQCMNSAHIRG